MFGQTGKYLARFLTDYSVVNLSISRSMSIFVSMRLNTVLGEGTLSTWRFGNSWVRITTFSHDTLKKAARDSQLNSADTCEPLALTIIPDI